MQLTFESLGELHAMIAEMGYVRQKDVATVVVGDVSITGSLTNIQELAGSVQPVAATGEQLDELAAIPPRTEAAEPANVQIDAAGVVHRVAAEPVKRKRRTKAEIEAEKAGVAALDAQDDREIGAVTAQGNAAGSTAGTTSSAPADPLANLQPQPGGDIDAARAEIAAQAPLFAGEGSDAKLAHLNEGRAFIEKHGFPAYNETLALANVPANIAGHTAEQVSMHRSAMAWANARKTGEA